MSEIIKEQRLTVLDSCNYVTKYGKALPGYKCKCTCGNIKIVRKNDFNCGKIRSCGCLIRDFNASRAKYYEDSIYLDLNDLGVDKRKRDKILNSYHAMMSRCHNPNNRNYKNYGGRGIMVCNEWRNSKRMFAEWALRNGFEIGKSIDRIDVNKNYSPENCRWATNGEQARNTRRNVYIKYNGEQFVITDLARILDIDSKYLSPLAKKGIELSGGVMP